MLDEHSPVPLYRQLADALSDQIRAGQYSVGDRIPSEHALCRDYGVGRPTVRQATDLLVRRRLLQRRRGAGTFVREPSAVDLFSLAGTLRGFEQSGLQPEPELLRPLARVSANVDEAEHPFAGMQALYFERLTRVAGEPVLLERFHLHAELFAPLLTVDLASEPLSVLVERRLHMRPREAEQHFDVVVVGDVRARHLGVPPDTSLLRVKRFIHFHQAESAIHVELLCRTDRLSFRQTIAGIEHA